MRHYLFFLFCLQECLQSRSGHLFGPRCRWRRRCYPSSREDRILLKHPLFIEDLYLALGPGHVTTQAGAKINVVASLLWVRNQHAANLKELMIAKKTGWQVLRNFKNQVIFLRICSFLFYSIQIFPFRDRLFNMRSVQAGVHLALKFSNTGTCLCPVVAFLFSYLHRY